MLRAGGSGASGSGAKRVVRCGHRPPGRPKGCRRSPGMPRSWGTRVKIREIRAAGLRGATPEGGWSNELRPEECVHTLLAVHTDEGAVGIGSVFTSDDLVCASLAV